MSRGFESTKCFTRRHKRSHKIHCCARLFPRWKITVRGAVIWTTVQLCHHQCQWWWDGDTARPGRKIIRLLPTYIHFIKVLISTEAVCILTPSQHFHFESNSVFHKSIKKSLMFSAATQIQTTILRRGWKVKRNCFPGSGISAIQSEMGMRLVTN